MKKYVGLNFTSLSIGYKFAAGKNTLTTLE
jgi:hypothetical protein